jgi:hypothetical protein
MDFNLIYQTLNKIKPLIIKVYLFTVGLAIIIFYLYIRLFSKVYQYDLQQISEHVTILYICISVLFILFHIMLVILSCYALYKRYLNVYKEHNIIKYIQKVVSKLYWEPLEFIHDLIAPDLPYSGTLIIKYTESFQTMPLWLIKFIPCLFLFMPRVIVSIIFFIEIIFYNRIYYFVHILIILLLPPLYQIFQKLCSSFVTRNRPVLEEHLIIIPAGEPNMHGIHTAFNFQLPSSSIALGYTDEHLKENSETWMLLFYLNNYNQIIKTYIETYSLYVSVLSSSLYVFAGIYKTLLILSLLSQFYSNMNLFIVKGIILCFCMYFLYFIRTSHRK